MGTSWQLRDLMRVRLTRLVLLGVLLGVGVGRAQTGHYAVIQGIPNGDALNIDGPLTGNGDIVLVPGNVSGHSSTLLDNGRTDQPALILSQQHAGNNTSDILDILNSSGSIVFSIAGSGVSGGPGPNGIGLYGNIVPDSSATYNLGTSSLYLNNSYLLNIFTNTISPETGGYWTSEGNIVGGNLSGGVSSYTLGQGGDYWNGVYSANVFVEDTTSGSGSALNICDSFSTSMLTCVQIGSSSQYEMDFYQGGTSSGGTELFKVIGGTSTPIFPDGNGEFGIICCDVVPVQSGLSLGASTSLPWTNIYVTSTKLNGVQYDWPSSGGTVGQVLQIASISGSTYTMGWATGGGSGVSSITATSTQTGALTFQGTTDEVSVTNSGTTFTWSLPQVICTTCGVQFLQVTTAELIGESGETTMDGNFVPTSADSFDLGTSSDYWAATYTDGLAVADISGLFGSTVDISANLAPFSNLTYSLGTPSDYFLVGYFGNIVASGPGALGSVTIGTGTTTSILLTDYGEATFYGSQIGIGSTGIAIASGMFYQYNGTRGVTASFSCPAGQHINSLSLGGGIIIGTPTCS